MAKKAYMVVGEDPVVGRIMALLLRGPRCDAKFVPASSLSESREFVQTLPARSSTLRRSWALSTIERFKGREAREKYYAALEGKDVPQDRPEVRFPRT